MRKTILVGSLLAVMILLSGCDKPGLPSFLGGGTISKEEAMKMAGDFINNNLKVKSTVKEVTEENGLYKVIVTVNGKDYDTYMTKDGKKLFRQVPDDLTALSDQNNDDQNQSPVQDQPPTQTQAAAKADVPEIQLFVMSYCPYGTQIEKGILPALDTLGSKIKFKLEFVDYAMHGEKEIDENMRQYCIMKDQPTKFESYLKCFLQAGDSSGCIQSSGTDQSKLDSCMSATDKQFKVKEKLNDKSTWSSGQFPPFDINKEDNVKYGIKGSPALVINGAQVSPEGRDPKSLLKAICSGFNNPPEECQKQLSSDSPSPGFDSAQNGSGSGDGGSCNTN